MKKMITKIFQSLLFLVLVLSCKQGLDNSTTNAVSKKSKCGKQSYAVGKRYFVTTDAGSYLTVRDGNRNKIGTLKRGDVVTLRTIKTRADLIGIYYNKSIRCSISRCNNKKIYVSYKFLDPTNKNYKCKYANSSSSNSGSSSSNSSITAYKKFSLYSKTVKTMRYANRHYGKTRSKGYCLRGVKKAMTYGGRFYKSYPGVAWAVRFGGQLNRINFTNIYSNSKNRGLINKSMRNIPVGCAVIYQAVNRNIGRNSKYGHIEVRLRDGFISDYKSWRPRTGSWSRASGKNRKIKSVWCKKI